MPWTGGGPLARRRRAGVLVRGCRWEPVVASPLYKQRYALMDGRCLDDPALSVACWRGAAGERGLGTAGVSGPSENHVVIVNCPVIFVRDSTFLVREDGGKTFFGNNGQTFCNWMFVYDGNVSKRSSPCAQDPMIASLSWRTGSASAAPRWRATSPAWMRQGACAGRGYVLREGPYAVVIGGANMDICGCSYDSLRIGGSNPGGYAPPPAG